VAATSLPKANRLSPRSHCRRRRQSPAKLEVRSAGIRHRHSPGGPEKFNLATGIKGRNNVDLATQRPRSDPQNGSQAVHLPDTNDLFTTWPTIRAGRLRAWGPRNDQHGDHLAIRSAPRSLEAGASRARLIQIGWGMGARRHSGRSWWDKKTKRRTSPGFWRRHDMGAREMAGEGHGSDQCL